MKKADLKRILWGPPGLNIKKMFKGTMIMTLIMIVLGIPIGILIRKVNDIHQMREIFNMLLTCLFVSIGVPHVIKYATNKPEDAKKKEE